MSKTHYYLIDGIEYDALHEASIMLEVSYNTVRSRIQDDQWPTWQAVHRKTGEVKNKGIKYVATKGKKCSKCGSLFIPTVKRRMLCVVCFTGPSEEMPYDTGYKTPSSAP